MVLIVTGEMAAGAAVVNSMLASVGHELEIAHDCFVIFGPTLSMEGQLAFTAISMGRAEVRPE